MLQQFVFVVMAAEYDPRHHDILRAKLLMQADSVDPLHSISAKAKDIVEFQVVLVKISSGFEP